MADSERTMEIPNEMTRFFEVHFGPSA